MWERGEIAPKEQFLLFSTLFYVYISKLGVKLHIHLLNVVVQFIVCLTLSTLICRGTDISKSFSESLGIWDNESRLYSDISEQTVYTLIKLFLKAVCVCACVRANGEILAQSVYELAET